MPKTDENDFEYECTNIIICPYCDHEHEIDGGSSPYEDGLYQDIDCSSCGKTYEVHTSVIISFSTYHKESKT